MREIGSEFCEQHEPCVVENHTNEAYLLSGRTALRFIIDDICKTRVIKKALLPSYCCESMILPFIQSGIKVDFYSMDCDKIYYPYDNDADIVFLIDLFGYAYSQNIDIARFEKKTGKIVIYDSTHKIDGNYEVQNYVDYSFCSYRKWFYCNYAKAIKHSGEFGYAVLSDNEQYISIRNQAAYEKRKYIESFTGDKKIFLSKFSEAECILENDYIGYAGQPVIFNLQEIMDRRKKNATYLISALKDIPQIKLWRDGIKIDDAPMFVPILVEPSVRDDLRKKLIEDKIYCPIHWPRSIHHTMTSDLYAMELSLVCDQRYEINDMERIVESIKEFFII